MAVDVKSLGQRPLAPPAIWNTGRRSHHIVASNRYANETMTMVVPPGLQNTVNMKIMLLPALDDDKYGAASVYDGLDGPLPLRLRTTPMDVGMPHLTMPLDLHRPAGLGGFFGPWLPDGNCKNWCHSWLIYRFLAPSLLGLRSTTGHTCPRPCRRCMPKPLCIPLYPRAYLRCLRFKCSTACAGAAADRPPTTSPSSIDPTQPPHRRGPTWRCAQRVAHPLHNPL